MTACGWCERNFLDSTTANGEQIAVLDILALVERALAEPAADRPAAAGEGTDPMTVSTAVLDELRGIVGARNYTDDPAILETYRYSLSHTAIHLGPYFDVVHAARRRRRPAGLHRGGAGDRPAVQPRAGAGSSRRPRSGPPRATRPRTTP